MSYQCQGTGGSIDANQKGVGGEEATREIGAMGTNERKKNPQEMEGVGAKENRFIMLDPKTTDDKARPFLGDEAIEDHCF